MMSYFIKTMVKATTDDTDVAELTAQVLQTPDVTVRRIQSLANSRAFQSFFLNEANQAVLNSGRIELMVNNREFAQLVKQPDFVALLSPLLEQSSELPEAEQYAIKIKNIWSRAQFVKYDTQAQTIINDPEIKQMLSQSNYVELLNSNKLITLFERLTSEDAKRFSLGHYKQQPTTRLEKTTVKSIKQQKLYKWVDEKGRVHYSDQKPPDDPES
jgi:hypothetical protein